ncbi:MAG: hypothetical protein H7256_05950 [Bdellovibrio sp.]|nr:hypothetical protein [Bdellovibrio sp.]
MSQNMRWVFYDSLSKTQSNPITTEEAQMALFKMRPRDIERFYVWTQGWQQWQNLHSYLETDQKYFVGAFTITNEDTVRAKIRDVLEMTPAKNKKLHEEIAASYSSIHLGEETITNTQNRLGQEQFDGETISWENLEKPTIDFSKLKNKSVENRDKRHELKIEVILISPKGKTFRSKSQNISLSGSLLEDNIPFDYYGIVFDVVVIHKESKKPKLERISLKGKTVGEGLTQRLQYVDVSPEKKTDLQDLLQDYVDQQKNYKKSA